jgi:type I restriction-modification system DNA methylase subunit
MLTQEQLQPIAQLVEHYERLSDADRRRYSETETRTNFVDRLFLALGWPVYDRVHVERETTVAEGKRPDYIFKLHGVPRLFLEAKPFREDIYDLALARDAITKAYNKGVPWAGVTNFAALVIFDAQEELRPGAPPARALDLTYPDYLHADSGLHYLTREALDQRLLEQQAQRTGTRPRGVPIEKRLYESMRQWRESLFNHMRTALAWKTDAQLRTGDEAIQRLIDRLIFLRNCEDRDIGTTDLRALLHRIRSRDRNVRVTDSLLRLFAEAAATYDSELFQTEALIDVLLQGLATTTDVHDTLAEIIQGLYSVPRSYAEYDFAQMDADVLGQVYEQYLGYVPQYIRKLAAQKTLPGFPAREITVEAKRQRRKEHGIYYTPRWVVHYIVQQTLGRFLEYNRDNEEAIANLTILDPACGSGSFLIHAYETLLGHHAARMGGDVGHLDTRTREWILTHNIFGVDLDPQAVEIARLNLLIRMVRQQEQLPPLADNIRLGNSLISGSQADLRPYFADACQDKHPFNWDQEFQEIMARGGFDIVIGNPPYVRIQTLPRDEVACYNDRYEAATGSYDIYALFVERGLQLLRPGGMLGFIIPNKFMQAQYGKGLRKLLAGAKAVSKIVDFGDAQVFESGTNYTCLLFLRKEDNKELVYVPAADVLKANPALPNLSAAEQHSFPARLDSITAPTWVFVPKQEDALMAKLREAGAPLGQVCEKIFVGLQTSADDVYILEKLGGPPDGLLLVRSRRNGKQYLLESAVLKPLLSGHDIKRYLPAHTRHVLLFPYRVDRRKATLISPEEFAANFPAAWEYLVENRERLEGREGGRFQHDRWYEFGRSQNLGLHEEPKLCVPRLVRQLEATYEGAGAFYLDNVDVNGVLGLADPVYVLGVLNSRVVNFYFQRITVPFHSGFRSANRQFIEPLPIRMLDLHNQRERKQHDDLVGLAQRMLDLHQRLAAKGDLHDSEREQIEREIGHTDREIDALVYDLYGLTAAERALVEAEIKR